MNQLIETPVQLTGIVLYGPLSNQADVLLEALKAAGIKTTAYLRITIRKVILDAPEEPGGFPQMRFCVTEGVEILENGQNEMGQQPLINVPSVEIEGEFQAPYNLDAGGTQYFDMHNVLLSINDSGSNVTFQNLPGVTHITEWVPTAE